LIFDVYKRLGISSSLYRALAYQSKYDLPNMLTQTAITCIGRHVLFKYLIS